MDLRLIVAVLAATTIMATLVVLSVRIKKEPVDVALNITCVLLGVAIGWLAGIFLSPYSEAQAAQWRQYAQAVSIFVSGYLLAKIDPLITRVLSAEAVLSVVAGFRLATFMITAIVAMITTFAIRTYAAGIVVGR